MRILDVTCGLAVLIGAAMLGGCDKPEPAVSPKNVDIAPTKNGGDAAPMPRALWFTSGLATAGSLGRLDLKTGDLKFDVLSVGGDTQVFQDGDDGLLLLTRQFLDSITVLRGIGAQVVNYKSLPPPRPDVTPNAQGIARDAKGRVWVTLRESNQVLVFSPDVRTQVGSVDLSNLKVSDEPDAVADLAQIAQLDERHMVVTAQRMHRGVSRWRPAAQSGLAVIDIETLQPVSSGLVDLPNPQEMAVHAGKVTVVGAGDLSGADGAMGRVAVFSSGSLVVEKSEDLPAKVIAADSSVAGEPPAMIAWYPNENMSCVQIGSKRLACDGSPENGGFVFYAIKRAGDRVFVSYNHPKLSQLWVLDTEGLAETKKFKMELPIQSLSFGP